MTASQLTKLCAYWQKTLRLQDWQVQVEFVPASGVSSLDHAGETHINIESKQALVKIVRPEDLAPSLERPDAEETLVHELLHLHLATLHMDPDRNHIEIEQIICCLASGLFGLKRALVRKARLIKRRR